MTAAHLDTSIGTVVGLDQLSAVCADPSNGRQTIITSDPEILSLYAALELRFRAAGEFQDQSGPTATTTETLAEAHHVLYLGATEAQPPQIAAPAALGESEIRSG